jgi:hypothetical protein
MIALADPAWHELQHAYGNASEVPAWLAKLASFPPDDADSEPWSSIWSALAHQGDVYSASFAASPHIISILSTNPERATPSFFHFPAWVEICSAQQNLEVPTKLAAAYSDALAKMPSLLHEKLRFSQDDDFVRCGLAAVAAASGKHAMAEAILELTPDVSAEFLEWFYSR